MIAPPRPPSHDELEALIEEARARQVRRRLLAAAGVAAAAAIGLGVHAFLTDGAAGRTTGGSPNAGVGAPLCRSSQLSASADGLNGEAFGTMGGAATLTNVSASVCSLPKGRPDIHILWQGRILPVREATEAADDPVPHPLAPHSKAFIQLLWSNWCGKPVEEIRPIFKLRFADGLRVDAPGWVARTPICMSPPGPSVLSVSRPFRSLPLTG
jgi:hypothetical protein